MTDSSSLKSSPSYLLGRRDFLAQTATLIASMPTLGHALQSAASGSPAKAKTSLAEPRKQTRPKWWRDEGMVAAFDTEPLIPRLRASGFDMSYEFMTYDQKLALWRRGHSEEIVLKLKDLGFNFILTPFYKGGGIKAEQNTIQAAKSFTEICHKHGMHVGYYLFSGTVFYESLLAEEPDAINWLTRDQNGHYPIYHPFYFRRWVNRSHPGFRAHMRELVRFAVQDAKVDLIHFDNYDGGAPGYEPYSATQFRQYIESRYTPEQRFHRFGFANVNFMEPPPPPPTPDAYNGDPLYQDFIDFRCETLADTYRELAELARSLNPDVILECNPGGYVGELNMGVDGLNAVDHTLLAPWGGVFTDEGEPCRLENGIMISRFRSQMLGRHFDNMVWHYTPDRVAISESMANNLQCSGLSAFFGDGEVIPWLSKHDPKKYDPAVLASIRFFRREQRYYQDTEQAADVGVLNTYANTAYGPTRTRQSWQAFTQALYQGKVPFTLVPDRCPGDLNRFRVLVLADLALISDELVNAIRSFVRDGGGLVMTGMATQFDEHSYRREKAGLADLFSETLGDKPLTSTFEKGRAAYLPHVVVPAKFVLGTLPENRRELLDAVRWAANGPLQVEVKAPETVTMSLYVQPGGRRMLHLVNYDEGNPVSNIEITMQQPSEGRQVSVKLLSPESDTPQTLPKQQRGRELRFTVPRLEVYGLLVIE
jgi:Beta-galactosidase trimerisation domain